MNCPFILPRVRTAALLFLRNDVRESIKAGMAQRTSGGFVEGELESNTRQPKFMCLSLEVRNFLVSETLGAGASYTRALVRPVRGYDVENEQELNQAMRKMGAGRRSEVLRMASLWCFSLGPGVYLPTYILARKSSYWLGANKTPRNSHHHLLQANGRHPRRPG
jgi:hypothetical protein